MRKEKSQQLLNKLSSNERYNLLSFNYTTPCTKDSSCNIKRNIHGKLEDHPIIGIDSKNISPDSPVFRFTKTYRIMTLASEKQDKLLPQTVKTIVFYGHSFAPADYSYFTVSNNIFSKCSFRLISITNMHESIEIIVIITVTNHKLSKCKTLSNNILAPANGNK